jgi:polysaccharide export outer membrane protein
MINAMRQLAPLWIGSVLIATPLAAQNQPPRTETAPDRASYRVNPGDELEIYVWGEERLQRPVRVLPDGTVAFPLAGRISVKGRLLQEIEAAVTDALRDQYRGDVPQVTVSVISPAGLQFSVLGRVNSPGTFTPGRYVNVLEALSMAGGGTEFANLDDVVIVRKNGEDLQVLRAQLAPLLRKGVNNSDLSRANLVRIEAGDTIIVP